MADPQKRKKVANPTLVMLVQQIDVEFWDNSDPAFTVLLDAATAAAALPEGDARTAALRDAAGAIAEYIVARWEADGREVTYAHAILHDADTQQVWDEARQETVPGLKPLHLHLLVKFASQAKSSSVDKLAALVGLEQQSLELDKSRGGKTVEVCGHRISQQHDNGLAYLVHIKYSEKSQYDPRQVADVRSTLVYELAYGTRRSEWLRGRAHIVKKRAAENVEELREMILSGEVTKSQIMLTDELFEVYSRHMVELDRALDAYGQRRAYRAADKLRKGEFQTTVVFVHGPSGHGKTHLATSVISTALELAAAAGERWSVYRAATNNPLDDWCGEEVIFLDETRAQCMDANDWLLLLDPVNASPARARYRNKGEVAPRLIMLTATIEPVEFFFYTRQKGAMTEALDQFIRRLAAVVRVVRADADAEPRYWVGAVGPVDQYTRVIEHEQPRALPRGGGPDGSTSTELTLNYGAPTSVEHTPEGAVGAVMGALVKRSPDVPFADTEWPALEARVFEEAQEHDVRTARARDSERINALARNRGLNLTPEQRAAAAAARAAEEAARVKRERAASDRLDRERAQRIAAEQARRAAELKELEELWKRGEARPAKRR